MILFTFLAVQVLLWQSNDISVSIVSETDEGSKEVTISVLNTAGATLLFYENPQVKGKIEYLSNNGWVEYCDVSYTAANEGAVSLMYSDTFAELEPGEEWDIVIPENKVADMKDGTYRIKMIYVTEKNYIKYLDDALETRNEESTQDISDIPNFRLDNSDMIGFRPTAGVDKKVEEDIIEEKFPAESICEIFIKTFEYSTPEDFVGEISINDEDINNKNTKAKIKIN